LQLAQNFLGSLAIVGDGRIARRSLNFGAQLGQVELSGKSRRIWEKLSRPYRSCWKAMPSTACARRRLRAWALVTRSKLLHRPQPAHHGRIFLRLGDQRVLRLRKTQSLLETTTWPSGTVVMVSLVAMSLG
jgi:hypothetical protein